MEKLGWVRKVESAEDGGSESYPGINFHQAFLHWQIKKTHREKLCLKSKINLLSSIIHTSGHCDDA